MRKLVSLFPLLVLLACSTQAHANLWGKVKIGWTAGVMAQDDPIVSPGNVGGADHMHASCGSTEFGANMTTGAMLNGGTTSFLRENKSSTWVATMRKDGVDYRATCSGYYAGNGANPAAIAGGKIQMPPNGLRFVVGNSNSTVLQSPSFVRWRCGQSVNTTQTPPTSSNCMLSYSMEIDGPECWDGMQLDSPDHRSHVARHSSDGGCPASHPVRIPHLQMTYAFAAASLGGRLSCDDPGVPAGSCAHFDYWFAHDADQLDQILRCLNDANRNSPNSPSCGVFTYDASPWQTYLISWSIVVGYVRSNGDPNYGSAPPPTP